MRDPFLQYRNGFVSENLWISITLSKNTLGRFLVNYKKYSLQT